MGLFDRLTPVTGLVGDGDAESALRVQLIEAQQALIKQNRAAIIIVSGVNGGGKGAVIRLLNEWLDQRFVMTYAFNKRSDEESERPLFWRYWMALPPRGRLAVYVGSWYSEAIKKFSRGKITRRAFSRMIRHIQQLESDLSSDGMIILKYWLHLDRGEQKDHFQQLLSDKSTAWRVTKEDLKEIKNQKQINAVAEEVIEATESIAAPWQLLKSTEPTECAWHVARDLIAAVNTESPENVAVATKETSSPAYRNVLAKVDLEKTISKSKYQKRLVRYQARFGELHRRISRRGISSVIVFEGWDAAGKGGTIRRITYALDPRQYQVIRISAPTDEELAHHYLWRFWRHIPRAGRTTIYDRSWYGRVLVERVEAYTSEHRWRQAYDEINDFEKALVEHGTVMCKFWLHISPEEQLRRFEKREQIPHKKHKITADDYRNREQWDSYVRAVNEMIARTDTSWAPWQVIAANDKRHARVQVLDYLCEAFAQHR